MLGNDPWRCSGCKALMYDIDRQGYPVAGAPIPHYWNKELPTVCAMCWQMLMAAQKLDKPAALPPQTLGLNG